MTEEEHGDIPRRVDDLEQNLRIFQRDVAGEFKALRAESAAGLKSIGDKLDEQSRTFAAAEADGLRRGQFNLSSTIKSLLGAGVFLLALVGAGATALKAPIESRIERSEADIKKLEDNYVSRAELMVRFNTIDRDIDRGAAGLAKVADNAVMKPELDYRLTTIGRARDESFAQINGRLDRLRGELDRVTDRQVSRSEHKDRWDAEDKRIEGMQRQVDSLEIRARK